MNFNPTPAEYWFSLGHIIAHCGRRLRWASAPGYKLIKGRKIYCLDGKNYPVTTFRVEKIPGDEE